MVAQVNKNPKGTKGFNMWLPTWQLLNETRIALEGRTGEKITMIELLHKAVEGLHDQEVVRKAKDDERKGS